VLANQKKKRLDFILICNRKAIILVKERMKRNKKDNAITFDLEVGDREVCL